MLDLPLRQGIRLTRMIHRFGRVGQASRVPGGPRSLCQTWLRRRTANYGGTACEGPPRSRPWPTLHESSGPAASEIVAQSPVEAGDDFPGLLRSLGVVD